MDDKAYEKFCDGIKELICSGYEVMLFHQGFGETVMFTQLIYKYKELSHKKLCILVKVDTRGEILRACPYIDEVIDLPTEMFNRISSDGSLRIYCRIKSFLDLHNIIGINKRNVRVQVCDFLGIPEDTPLVSYPIGDVNANWDEYFEHYNLKYNKTVYVVPHALFLQNTVSKEFWEKLVSILYDNGFSVIINMPEEYIKGVPFAYFDIKTSLALASRCGYIVGVRTGFMDLAASFTKCNIQAIYPDDSHPSWDICKKELWKEPIEKNYAVKYMEGWSIKNIFGKEDANEIVYTNDEDVIRDIMKKLLFDSNN